MDQKNVYINKQNKEAIRGEGGVFWCKQLQAQESPDYRVREESYRWCYKGFFSVDVDGSRDKHRSYEKEKL